MAGKGGGQKKQAKTKTFEVCKHGCRYRTIQKAVDAAGSFKAKKKNAKVKAVVAVRPGKYVEGVVARRHPAEEELRRPDDQGDEEGPQEGRSSRARTPRANWAPRRTGSRRSASTALVLKNMWARNYQSNGFFIHAANEGGQHCDGYTMDNLLASANRSYGLFAKNCFGGKMINSAGYHHGDSAFYVGETPCDSKTWTNHGIAPPPKPCQRKPKWTLLKNDRSYENVLGYSGTNSKYVKIVESAFYNNGAGIVPNTLDSEGFEPNGWNVFERNDVFWNNYNYFLAGSKFHTVSGGLGQVAGATVNYPTGVGIVLYGGANNVVKDNNVFGNYKWGIASFSGPGEVFVANEGDDAKNINNQIVENTMGREGIDPNGEFDFWNDATGGGNCWGNNSAGDVRAGQRQSAAERRSTRPARRPRCSPTRSAASNITAGLQINLGEESDPKTILGYASSNPPQKQECTWVRRVAAHPAFQKFQPVEVAPAPGEVSCG